MSKTRSKIKLCIVAVLTIIGLILTFVSFVIPTTNTTFRGFFGAINLGYDINGGRLAVFEIADDNMSSQNKDMYLDESLLKLRNAFESEGYNITRQGDTIRIEASKYDDENMTDLLGRAGSTSDLMDLIGSSEGISINTSSSDANAEGSITSEFIDRCEWGPNTQGAGYRVSIIFTEAGQEMLREMTQGIIDSGSGSVYIYLDGQNYNSLSASDMLGAMTSIDLYSESTEAAESLAIRVNALAKPATLRKIVDNEVTSGLNTDLSAFFGNMEMLTIIFLAILLLATIIFLLVRYRVLGLLATVSLGIFLSVYAFLLQSIPLVVLDLNGLLGVMFVYALLVSSIVEIFERIRFEYKQGKKIPNSVMSAFRNKTLTVLEKYLFVVIMCAIFYIVGGAGLKYFAVSTFIGMFVNYFVLFVALRGTCYSYININSTRKNFYNLKREVGKNEI